MAKKNDETVKTILESEADDDNLDSDVVDYDLKSEVVRNLWDRFRREKIYEIQEDIVALNQVHQYLKEETTGLRCLVNRVCGTYKTMLETRKHFKKEILDSQIVIQSLRPWSCYSKDYQIPRA